MCFTVESAHQNTVLMVSAIEIMDLGSVVGDTEIQIWLAEVIYVQTAW